ncbi:beta strand repeat-containing protein [Prosthecobacter sp.]|uniref:beta strand repeat-containing protein n=1 Tax=Prosthecobacter sp. TaxID=1965333 RepID=UPI003783471A
MLPPSLRPLLLLSFISMPAHAATLTWLGDVNASWGGGSSGVNTNWTSNALSVNGDSLVFDLTTAGVANLSSTNDLSALTLGGTNALTFANDGGTNTGFSLTGNSITLGGNITSTGTTGTHTHTLSLGLILSGTRTLTAASTTTFVIDGIISESGGSFGFIKSGTGTAVLSATNSFTGAVSVSQGTLSVSSIADSGVSSALGAGGVINLGSGTTAAGTLLYTGAAASTNRTVNLAATTTGAATINSSGTGAVVFTGSFTNAGTGAKVLTLGGSSVDSNEIRSVLGNGSGTLSVTKANGGTWLLSAVNTFTGNVSISQGILVANSVADGGVSSALGAGSVINFGSGGQTGTLSYTGAAASMNRTINLSSTGTGSATLDASGTGALVLTGNVTNAATSGTKVLTLNGSTAGNDFQGIISDGGLGGVVAVTKGDTGTWILSGMNTFTGSVSVLRATLSVNSVADSGVPSALGAGTTINLGSGAQAGTLNYTGAGGTSNRTLVLASTGAGGGTLTNSGSGALVFTGGFTNAGTGAKTLTLNGSNTGANELQAALTDSNGGALALVKSGAGAWSLSGTSSFTGALSVNQGTLTVTSLADGGTSSAAGAGSTINLGITAQTGTVNYTGGGAATNRALVLAATGTGGGTVTSNGTGALVFTGVVTNTNTGTRTLTLGGSNTAANELRSVVADGGGTLALAKVDAGTWSLSGLNTYSGGTTLSAGTLVLNSAAAAGTGALTLNGGALDNGSGAALTLSTNNAVAWNGSVTFNGSNSLNLGTGVVTIGNANRDFTLNGSSTLTTGEVQWNSTAGTRILTVNQGTGSGATLVLGGFQLNINADTAARNRTITGTGNVTISGAVVNGNGFANGIIYTGSGTLTLAATNGYTGATIVSGGTVALSGGGSVATSSSLTINAGTVDVGGTNAGVNGGVTLGAATTTVGGQTMHLVSSMGGGSFTPGGNVTYNAGSAGFENGQATISAGLVLTADRTFTVNDSPNAAVDVLVSGVISGSFALVKANDGTLRLGGTNTYTGQTQLNNGVTEIYALGNIGVTGSLGTGNKDITAGIIRFGSAANTGTLDYLGGGDSSNRRIQIGSGTGAAATGGATILNSGTGALVFTASAFNSAVTLSAAGASTARVLTLGGSNTNANTIQGAIINNTGAGTSGTSAVAVVKQDAGLWILAGSSTYSGGTTVSGGTLVLNNSTGSATGSGSVSIGTGASLGGSGALSTSGTVTLQSGGTLFAGQAGVIDAQMLMLRADAGYSLSGEIVLDITGGGVSGVLNAHAGNNDMIDFNGGAITLTGATLTIHTSLPATSGVWAAGTTWKLFDWAGVSTRFDNLPDTLQQGNVSGLPDLSGLGLDWDWSHLYSDGTLSVSVLAASPEPTRTLLLLPGFAGMLMLRRRARQDATILPADKNF